MFDILLWTGTVFFLGFYFGKYEGEKVYRFCRYWKYKIKRRLRDRNEFKNRVILNA